MLDTAKLRNLAESFEGVEGWDDEVEVFQQAADEIERLRTDLAREIGRVDWWMEAHEKDCREMREETNRLRDLLRQCRDLGERDIVRLIVGSGLIE